jgi:hypothetical protein
MTAALAVRTSPATPRAAPPPLIRLRPAPSLEPPFDEQSGLPPIAPAPLDEAPQLPLEWARPRRTVPGVSEAKLAAHRYLTLCLEVLGGFRPLAHLRTLSSAATLEQIAAQLARSRTAAPPKPSPGDRITLRQTRICEPGTGVAEVAAVLGRAGQVWAMALRMERHQGAWLCTHLQVL